MVKHPFIAGLRGVQAGIDEMSQASVWSMSDADVAGALAEISVAEARLAAGRLALVG